MKFLLTKELGRLAKWLRILGFDARYESSGNKSVAMIEALKEERILLTRNLRFGTRHGGIIIFVKHDGLQDQLRDVFSQIDVKLEPDRLFSRCTVCNESLAAVAKERVRQSVPAYVFEAHEDFMRCCKCQRVYWKGTHWGNAEEVLKKLIKV